MKTETTPLAEFAWSAAHVRDAIELLLGAARLPVPQGSTAPRADTPSLRRAIDVECQLRGVDAQPSQVFYDQIEEFIRRGGPALFVLETRPEEFFALVRTAKENVQLVMPDGTLRWLAIEHLVGEVRRSVQLEQELREGIQRCFALPDEVAERAARLACDRRVAFLRAADAWLIRLPASAHMVTSARANGAVSRLAGAAVLSILSAAITLVAFLALGAGVLTAHLGLSTIGGAGAAMISAALLGAAAAKFNGLVQLDISVVIKSRLFEGVLKMPVDKLRHGGVGVFLGMVSESEEFEESALLLIAGVFQMLGSLGVGVFLLALGAASWSLLTGFLVVLSVEIACSVVYYRRMSRATDLRLACALTIVENLAGQRTRVVQQAPEDWHVEEDTLLAAYNAAAHTEDIIQLCLRVAPRAWMVVAFGILGWSFVAEKASAITLAVVGIIVTYQALSVIGTHLQSGTRLMVALRTIRALLGYGGAEEREIATLEPPEEVELGERLVELRGVRFAYPTTGRLVLDSVTVNINDGDRLLLMGTSGGGKSTLVHVLSGLREPDAGLLLFRGTDAQSLSEAVRRRIVAITPQFHENHIFSDTLKFNLLLGRGWPPTRPDLIEAVEICRELGLGSLLERMPRGLEQIVGDSGWQLSHGERSRIFIARALLQKAPVVVFDESFGALDTETTQRCMECVVKRSRATLVVAHP